MTEHPATPNHHLRQARLRQHWSQRELAARLNTSFVNISRWERGVTVPGVYFRQQLCELFGVAPQELGLSTDPPAEEPSSSRNATTHAAQMPLWHVPYPRNPFFSAA